jgi:hypothetical protein
MIKICFNHPIGGNSPNLVTLVGKHPKKWKVKKGLDMVMAHTRGTEKEERELED